MSLANDLDQVWRDAAGIFADAFYTDTYEIKTPTHISDGRGGTTETLAVVESGTCALDVDTTRSGEQQIGDRIVTRSTYRVTMPLATSITTQSDLWVNGRHFNVQDVKRQGDWATDVEVWAEEVL